MKQHNSQFLALALGLSLAVGKGKARADDPVPPPPGQTEWKLSPFLTGSSEHIRDLINGPLESALARQAVAQKELHDCQLGADKKADTVLKTAPDSIQLHNDLAETQKQMATARDQHNMVAMIDAQNRVESDQHKLRSLLGGVIANDPQFAAERKKIRELTGELRQIDPAVTNASKARDQLLDGLRTALRMYGPAKVGAKGILGRIRPTKIIDGQSFTCDYNAFEIQGQVKDAQAADGFKTWLAIPHQIHLLVMDVGTSSLRVGSDVQADETFQITGIKEMNRTTYYTVERNETDPRDKAYDGLLRLLNTLRMPAPSQGE